MCIHWHTVYWYKKIIYTTNWYTDIFIGTEVRACMAVSGAFYYTVYKTEKNTRTCVVLKIYHMDCLTESGEDELNSDCNTGHKTRSEGCPRQLSGMGL